MRRITIVDRCCDQDQQCANPSVKIPLSNPGKTKNEKPRCNDGVETAEQDLHAILVASIASCLGPLNLIAG